jgi:hypothetical protein
MRYSCALQPCDDWAQGIALVLRVGWRSAWVAYDMQLMRLQYSLDRVEEQARIFGRPEVQVYRMQPVHVFALV